MGRKAKGSGNGIFSMQRDKLKTFMTEALAYQAEAKDAGSQLSEHYKAIGEKGVHLGAFKAIQKILKADRGDALSFLEAFDNYREVLLNDMERDLIKEAQKKTTAAETVTASEVAEVVGEALTDVIITARGSISTGEQTQNAEPKKKRGRPSKAEMAAKAAAEVPTEGKPLTETMADMASEIAENLETLNAEPDTATGYSPDDMNMRAGAQAFKAGKSHLENPHQPGTERHHRWRIGYNWQASDTPEPADPAMTQDARAAASMF